MTPTVMTSMTGVRPGSRPASTTRRTTSRSESTPTSRVPSSTMTMPTFSLAIVRTASVTMASRCTVKRKSGRMMSRSFFIAGPPRRGRHLHRGTLLRNPRQIVQQQPRPPIDVVLANGLAHPHHSRSPLLRGHGHRRSYGIGHAVDVVRVDEQRIAELGGGTGELAQDQDSVIVVADGDELLGHEVHPVMQGGDHAEVGVAIERPDVPMLVMALEVDDGPPAPRLERAIDPLHGRLHLRLELLVAPDGAAARRRELDEDEALAIFGESLEEPPDGEEPLGDPLGVVEPLHSHTHELRRNTELREQLLPRGLGRIVDEGGGHADGERLDGGGVRPSIDREVLPVDASLHHALHGLQKIIAEILGVEADEVGPQHAAQEILLPGTDAERFVVRPRDVPEDGRARIGAWRLDEGGQEREVIVLDE